MTRPDGGTFSPAMLGLAILLLLGSSQATERTLDYAFNENCKELCKNTNVRLAHVRALGPNDTVHYLWDFTRNPTIFIAVTSPTAKLNIDWSSYISRLPYSVNFTENPTYTIGVVIERILEFNDINDEARIDQVNNTNIVELNYTSFQWNNNNLSSHDNLVELYIEAKAYNDSKNGFVQNGSISFLVDGFSTLNHSHVEPSMLHSENATQVDIVIDHLLTKSNFTKSRFAFELLIVSQSDPSISLTLNKKQNLDDEFTPGVFEVLELMSPGNGTNTGYVQWRPVSYESSTRHTQESTSTLAYNLVNASVTDYFNRDNLLYLYYGENMLNNLAQKINISIGQKEDNFYVSSNYTTWTFIVGYGSPPSERFSYTVIVVIVLGLGIPVLVLTWVGIYICRSQNQEDRELLIS